ncbi:MAG: UvrD-helicase domain-containing protein [Balneolaceae bacterium]
MFNRTEADEREYLKEIIEKLEDAYHAVNENVSRASRELKEQKSYLYENKTGMDAAEKAAVKQSVNMQAISGEAAVAYKQRLLKLIATPYFGRIDFTDDQPKNAEPIYVGIHSFFDEEENENLIHDWRAPVSGMFYDFEPGKASFETPSGTREGEIVRKRQYRIKDGELEMMLESDLYIRDDVLQKELSRSADDKMKNIVATIQRDQNRIIRNETSPALIIQGVAGSGKTSIALHRIAFLLYRFKESIESRDIMIISPNKVFSDYISNVLPELGEDTIPEMEMEEIARQILNDKYKFQSFFEQVNQLLEKHEPDFIERMEFKASAEFLRKLTSYVNWLKRERFSEEDIPVRYKTIPARYLRQRYNANTNLPLMRRHTAIAGDVIKKIKRDFKYDLKAEEKKNIRSSIKKMIGSTNLRVLYKEFYDWLERPGMFSYAKGSTYEYADLFPLVYLKMQLEGADTFGKVKHLIVDEMQDYSAVQYAVISRLFTCNKTILGDANQNVNPYSSTTAKDIEEVLSETEAVTLTKSYRSTWEITRFSLRISPGAVVDPVERHGEEPALCTFGKPAEEKKAILKMVRDYNKSDWNTLGIICKTQKQATALHQYLQKNGEQETHLLAPGSTTLHAGVLITCAHLAKGLEFDQVIVPHVTKENYQNEVDRSMLYIACTRAMHILKLTSCGEFSDLAEEQ